MALESLCIWLPDFEIMFCRIKSQNQEDILKILLSNVCLWDLHEFKMLTIYTIFYGVFLPSMALKACTFRTYNQVPSSQFT